jgi:polyphenol oxidase
MIESEQLKLPGISHGFFTRGGGHSSGIFASLNCGLGSGDDVDLVTRNREAAARQLRVDPSHLVSAYQVHGSDVVQVTQPISADDRPKADGLVCKTKGIAIGVLTADCAPLLFADHEAGVIGAAHAGWKGALAGVSDTVIAAMEKLGGRRRHMVAVIGPTISQANYEVGAEFAEAFANAEPETARFFTPSGKNGHYMFDLPSYLLHRLTIADIGEVVDLGLCTYADEARFYSFRRATHRGEKDYGRLISAIALI